MNYIDELHLLCCLLLLIQSFASSIVLSSFAFTCDTLSTFLFFPISFIV